MKFNNLSAIAVATLLVAPVAQAHFQLVYTPNLALDKGGEITLKMPFTHPASSGLVMEVAPPKEVYLLKKGKKIDLLPNVKEIQWKSAENTAKTYEVSTTLRGLGDNIFIFVPAPYFEKEEDKYIQQATKSIVNIGGLPTGWNKELGLETEIVPLTKPYAIREGGIFSGIVKSNGKAIPFAEIEIEYLNFKPDMANNSFAEKANTKQADIFVTETIYADANGVFNYALTKAGQWGFAALDLVEGAQYKGKPISKDAVIWVQAHDIN